LKAENEDLKRQLAELEKKKQAVEQEVSEVLNFEVGKRKSKELMALIKASK